MCFLNAGQFLFEALRSLDIQMVNFLMDMEGKVYGADFRVWKTMRLTTLQNWPPTMPLRAAGQRAHHMDPSTMLQLHAGHQKPILFLPKDAMDPFLPLQH